MVKEFYFEDGECSFTLTDEDILNNGLEDEEEELHQFVRTGEVGDVLSGINVNGIDVKRMKQHEYMGIFYGR